MTIKHILTKSQKTAINNLRPVDEDSTGLSKRITFVNYTGQEITVIERSNLVHKVPYVPNRYNGQFIIRTEYVIQNYMFNDFIQQLASDIDPELYPDLYAIKDAFFIQYKESKFYNSLRIVIDTIVEKEIIFTYKAVYVANCDLVLTCKEATLVKHPLSEFGLLEERFKDLTSRAGSSFTIEIIDNDHQVLPRFCFFANKLFKITPIADATRESGIYFTVTQNTNNGDNLETFKYSLDDAESLGLFKTKEEALSSGDLKTLRQEEIAKLNHENIKQKIELENLKLENAKKENELNKTIIELELKLKHLDKENKLLDQQLQQQKIKAEQERIKAEQERIKAEQEINREKQNYEKEIQRIKAEYEERKMKLEEEFMEKNYARRNTSEIIKTIGIILAAGLSIITLVAKFKQPKS